MNVLFRSIAGSKLYGLDTPDSDTDYVTVYIPTLQQLLLGTHKDTVKTGTSNAAVKNTSVDVDNLCYSLPFFIRKAATGKQQFIDAIHSATPIVDSPIWQDLLANRHKLYSKNMVNAVEFIDRQIYSYGHMHEINIAILKVIDVVNPNYVSADVKVFDFVSQLPVDRNCYWVEPFEGGYREIPVSTVRDKQTFYRLNGKLLETTLTGEAFYALIAKQLSDNQKRKRQEELNAKAWKEIMHAMRTGYQVLHIIREGGFTYPLPETDYLRAIRSGSLDFSRDIQPVAEELVANIKREIFASNLPDNVDEEFWEQWLYNMYGSHFGLPYHRVVSNYERCLMAESEYYNTPRK